jgi:hypothetical protein
MCLTLWEHYSHSQLIPIVLCISEIDKPLLFLKCLIQLISDIASILSYLHYQLLDTITVVGLGVTGKSFFVYAQKFSAGLCIFPLQSSALLFCHTHHIISGKDVF